MPRPKSENPRGQRVVANVTAEERGLVEAAAAAAGVSVSDYVRSRLLDPRVEALRLLERTEPPKPEAVARREPRKLRRPGRWCCPEPGCLENGESKEERCQKHGTLMLSRG